jgi:uncharacterized protein (TIGR02996 family)
MDLLSQHEAFLRAIFDSPEDDTPRLVYADFLQENGEEERAELIRVQCDDAQHERPVRTGWSRGFRTDAIIEIHPAAITDPRALREWVLRHAPHWFGAKCLTVALGQLLTAEMIDALFALPFIQTAADWRFAGSVEEVSGTSTDGEFPLIDIVQRPAVTTRAVEALAHHRGARRITALDLRNNNLDNDAARALVKSPYLDNLKRLQLLEGNRLRGRVWQQVIERFGEDVVG